MNEEQLNLDEWVKCPTRPNREFSSAQKFLDACSDSNIRNPMFYIQSLHPRLFGWMKGAFPRGILPTDIDGEVEIGGRFLRIESKHEDSIRSENIPMGQHCALYRLTETGFFHVLLIGIEESSEPTCYQIWRLKKGADGASEVQKSPVKEGGRAEIRDWCSKWSVWADKQENFT